MKRTLLAAFAALSPLVAYALYVNPDGTGQALIYPYYTVQSANGDAFNTYVSLVNHTASAKAVRVRLRESRAGKEVAALNVYLAARDTWTGAVLPDGAGGAKLVSSDLSCNSVQNGQPWALPLSGAQYSGPNDDGIAGGPERLREGWIEVLEMGEIGDPGAVAGLTHNAAGYPANCDAVEPGLASGAGAAGPPGGGLSGTLTLINVANGVNFAVKAEALDQLATRAFYRRASDPYPDFAAQEIDPVSVATTGRTTWVSYWINPFDAVSAALMREEAWGEYVLDKATASHTEIVLTFPTRQFYRTINSGYQAPVVGNTGWLPNCWAGAGSPLLGTLLGIGFYDREANGYAGLTADHNGLGMPQDGSVCASAAVLEVGTSPSTAPTGLLGSTTRGFYQQGKIGQAEDGWVAIMPYDNSMSMQSLNRSVRIDSLTGTVTTGAHVLRGMPMTGFVVRTFSNGTLHCSAGTCLGNYGGAYPLDYRRVIQPAS